MTCQELVELLTDFVANELPEPHRCQVEEHLSCCLHCQTYCDTYQITIRMSRRLTCRPMPDTLTQRMNAVVEALRREADPNTPRNC